MENTVRQSSRKGSKLKAVWLVVVCVYAGSVFYIGFRLSDCLTRYNSAQQAASAKVDAKHRITPAGNFAIDHFNNCRTVTRIGGGFRTPTTYLQKSESECASTTNAAAQMKGETFAQDVAHVLAARNREQVHVPDSDAYLLEMQRLKQLLDFLMLRW